MKLNSIKLFLIIISIAFCICLYACGSGEVSNQQENNSATQDSIHTEKSFHRFDKTLVNKTISRINNYSNDTTQSYAIYLPSDYDTLKSFPLVIFFDAHARGKLPLKKYQSLAEKYHFVFIGSNNSQNGMQLTETQNIATEILKDAIARININPKLIFASGFSGGSKVACSFAFNNSTIRGVIACASPFAEQHKTVNNHPEIFLLSGNEDFNMAGMVQADMSLSDAGFNHQLFVFDGKHDWPDEKYFEYGMQWIQQNAVKQNLMSSKFLTESVPDYNSWKETHVAADDLLNQEMNDEQEFGKQFTTADIIYWKEKISGFQKCKTSKKNFALKKLCARELNCISMMGFVYSESSLNQNNLPAAKHFLEIYELADATNPDVWFLKAIYYSKSGDNNSAFASLKKSAQLGYADINKLKNENSFSSIIKMNGFQESIFLPVLKNAEKE